jgi:hypothetical protein
MSLHTELTALDKAVKRLVAAELEYQMRGAGYVEDIEPIEREQRLALAHYERKMYRMRMEITKVTKVTKVNKALCKP